ncbi:hypothetical protein AM593_02483, partial [Mytilus galloprovincialis]
LNATQSEVDGCSTITNTLTAISTTLTTTERKTTPYSTILTYSTSTELPNSVEITDSTSTVLTYSTEPFSLKERTSLKLDTDNGTTAIHLNGCVSCFPTTTELTSTENTVFEINKGLHTGVIIGILSSCLLNLVLIVLVLYLVCSRKRKDREEKRTHDSTIENAEKETMTKI